MSRVGKKEIIVPTGVTVTHKDGIISVKGPKGELSQDHRPEVNFAIEAGKVTVQRVDDAKRSVAMHGLYRNLLANMIQGVTTGFSKTLLIAGTGYRAETKGPGLLLNLGYSTQIEFVPKGKVEIKCETPTKIIVSGPNKAEVGQAAAEIRGIRGPSVYSDKGIRYDDEIVRRKVGKTGVR